MRPWMAPRWAREWRCGRLVVSIGTVSQRSEERRAAVSGLCPVLVSDPPYRLVWKCQEEHGGPSKAVSFYHIAHGDLGVHSAVHVLAREQKITVAEIIRQLGHRDWHTRRADSDRQTRELETDGELRGEPR